MIDRIADWLAPACTMLAAILTASNLGARVTGAGFVVFTVGSIAWCFIAVSTNQSNLLWTNGFLVVVNLIGVWRWLGRQARFEAGARTAAGEVGDRGEAAALPVSRLVGAELLGSDGTRIGQVVDLVLESGALRPNYVVVSDGGVAGLGESLYGLEAHLLISQDGALRAPFDAEGLAQRPVLSKDDWPARLV